MKKKFMALSITLAACACQQEAPVQVPTTQELMADPNLLTDWEHKCNEGEFAHLPADQKQNFCFTTFEAARVNAAKAAGEASQNFYESNTKRKK